MWSATWRNSGFMTILATSEMKVRGRRKDLLPLTWLFHTTPSYYVLTFGVNHCLFVSCTRDGFSYYPICVTASLSYGPLDHKSKVNPIQKLTLLYISSLYINIYTYTYTHTYTDTNSQTCFFKQLNSNKSTERGEEKNGVVSVILLPECQV